MSEIVLVCSRRADKYMQLNEGKFMQNGRCGYVLKPAFMLSDGYNPYDSQAPVAEEPVTLVIKVIAARHLTKSKRGIVSPYVELEVTSSNLAELLNVKQAANNVRQTKTISQFPSIFHLKPKF